jgi:hypothetical protein
MTKRPTSMARSTMGRCSGRATATAKEQRTGTVIRIIRANTSSTPRLLAAAPGGTSAASVATSPMPSTAWTRARSDISGCASASITIVGSSVPSSSIEMPLPNARNTPDVSGISSSNGTRTTVLTSCVARDVVRGEASCRTAATYAHAVTIKSCAALTLPARRAQR